MLNLTPREYMSSSALISSVYSPSLYVCLPLTSALILSIGYI